MAAAIVAAGLARGVVVAAAAVAAARVSMAMARIVSSGERLLQCWGMGGARKGDADDPP